MLDLVGHIYREMTTTPGGYAGTPVHALYRDEVRPPAGSAQRARAQALLDGRRCP